MSDEPQRPTSNDDRDGWQAYWKGQGMPWRTEPEIDEERQRYLAERRAVQPDIEQGIYPYRDENGGIKLERKDVEWLLATHESDGYVGPVDWEEVTQRHRRGLDVRGAQLQDADLSALPLARLRGALTLDAAHVPLLSRVRRRSAKVHLERANLVGTHLEAADLRGVRLDGADLANAYLETTILYAAHLEGVNLNSARLEGADLRHAFFDSSALLHRVTVSSARYGGFRAANTRWNGVGLDTIAWRSVKNLGDDRVAGMPRKPDGTKKNTGIRLREYERAVSANRQLATALRNQGLNEDADRFAYRAQKFHRQILRRRHQHIAWASSWILDLISGYGYKPSRSLVAYVLIICLFAGAYLLNAQFAAPHLTWDEALVLSISSFHGRGFFTSGVSLGDTLARLAAGEAIIGLLIEITFIATFTQRFFAR